MANLGAIVNGCQEDLLAEGLALGKLSQLTSLGVAEAKEAKTVKLAG